MKKAELIKSQNACEIGIKVITSEAAAISALAKKIDDSFVKAVDMLYNCRGRVIISGIGKSGIIAQKIAATLTSTGTAAMFLHPAEAVHGDLGMVLKDDVVICISKSGHTDELSRLLPVFKQINVPIIAMTGNLRSALAEKSDVVLDVSVPEEACPYNLAPTTSSTAALVMGDALAVALLKRRNFSADDYAFLHPGGSLGKRLLLRVHEVMFCGDKIPVVKQDATLKEAILEISSKRFGSTCVVDSTGVLVGIITDGDLRRLLTQTSDIWNIKVEDVLTKNAKTISKEELAISAYRLMEEYNIMQIVVVDEQHKPMGMVHLHDLLEAGIS